MTTDACLSSQVGLEIPMPEHMTVSYPFSHPLQISKEAIFCVPKPIQRDNGLKWKAHWKIAGRHRLSPGFAKSRVTLRQVTHISWASLSPFGNERGTVSMS